MISPLSASQNRIRLPNDRAGLGGAPDSGTICLVFRWDGDRVGSRAMAKEFIARHDLERIALQEIRAFPGGEHVTDIEVEYQDDRALKTNWTLHVYTCEGANLERIHTRSMPRGRGCVTDTTCGENCERL